MNNLYVVTAVHNRYKITKKFIENLEKQSYKNICLILIDDGSNDGTDKMVISKMPNSIIIYGYGNLWWGGALDKAYKYLLKNSNADDYLLIMNDDTNIESHFLEIGVNLLERNRNSLITACGYSINDGKMIDGAIKFDFVTGDSIILPPNSEGNCASTRALFLSTSTMKKIGGFHPILLPHYGSDYEYTIRGYRKGVRIKSFNELKYTFDEGTTGYKDFKNLSFKKIFSKKSIINPLYKFTFILLVTPIKDMPMRLLFQFRGLIKRSFSR